MTAFKSRAFAQERAVAIEINGVSYAVMMLSPHDLEDFVIGFLFTENIISQYLDIHDIELTHTPISSEEKDQPVSQTSSLLSEHIIISVTLSNQSSFSFQQKMRLARGNSGCGICGARSLEQHFEKRHTLHLAQQSTKIFSTKALSGLRQKVTQHQQLSFESGAMHGAFLLSEQGDILFAREDIGRHNAIDKLIGHIVKTGQNIKDHGLLVTSRCSSELVMKTQSAGITTLLSFASPSDLALDIAKNYGICLIHIPQKDSPIVYFPNNA